MIASIAQKIKYLAFRPSQQQGFLEDVAALIDDGVPAKQAIETIASAAVDITKEVADSILVKIAEGQFIADGMYGWFPTYIVELVRAGEEGGSLADTLQIAAEALSKKNSAMAALLAAITYPLVVLAMGMAVAIFINHSIFNNFREMMPLAQWPATGRNVAEFATFVQDWWWALIIVLLGIIIGVVYMMRNYVGGGRQFLDMIPIFSLYRRVMAARFMQTLGLLINNGVVFKKALKILQYNANPYLAWHLLTMEYRLGGGKENVAEVLDTGLIDLQDLTRLKIIAHGKGFEHALTRQGKRALNNSELAMQRAARIAGAILLFCGAALAIFMILGVYNVGSAVGRY